MTAPVDRSRRELRLAVLLCLLGSVLVLFAVTRSWGDVPGAQDLTIRRVTDPVAGTKVAADVRALGLVGAAGVLALAATRRWGRVLVGVLVAVAGAGIAWRVGQLLHDGLAFRLASAHAGCEGPCRGVAVYTEVQVHHVWPVLTLVGAVVLLLAGLLVAVRGRHWATLSSSYDAPAAAPSATPTGAPVPPTAAPTDKAAWDALDRGDDPTA